MRICFLAPSGYGKTTAINILKKNNDICNIKIAEPLYELQNIFYEKIDIDIGTKQDGELLQFYGMKIRKENPQYLLKKFGEKVDIQDNNTLVTNDDCRPYDYDFLKNKGFIFIRINGYSRNREDHTEINKSLKIEWQSDIPYDYEINNFGNIEEYELEINKVMEEIKNDRKVLCYSYTKRMQ